MTATVEPVAPPSARLSDADALMWRIEADPVLRSPIVVVGLLDREPTDAALRAALGRGVAVVPRLHQRVVGGAGGLHWEEDPGFDLAHHLRRTTATVEVSGDDGVRAVLDAAEPDACTAFDPVRPLWQLTLVTGLGDGRAGFVLRFHHTITDGVGGVALAERLFDRTRRPSRTPHRAASPAATGQRPPAPVGPGTAVRAAGLVADALHAVRDPVGVIQSGWRTARSIGRMLAPAGAPLSPILLGRGIDRRFHVLEVPLDGLVAAAHAAGGTVNDAFLATVAGAVREYHDALGAPVRSVRVTMPISLRTAADAPGGNRFTPARFVLPVDDPDPRRRILLAGAIVRRWRAEPAVGLTSVLASVLNRLPGPVLTSAFGSMLRSIDVDAVDVPGLRHHTYFAGARLERMWAFAPPTGAALSITLVSHDETACIGLAADVAAVVDPQLLADSLARALDGVLALDPKEHRCRLVA